MITGKATPKLTGPDTVQGAIDTIEQYFENGWTDGLPIVPPTEELVDRMSRWITQATAPARPRGNQDQGASTSPDEPDAQSPNAAA